MLHAIISLWMLDSSLIKRGLREFITYYVNLASQVNVFHTNDFGCRSWSHWHPLWKCHHMQWEAGMTMNIHSSLSYNYRNIIGWCSGLQIVIIFFAFLKNFKDHVSVLDHWCCFSHFVDRLYSSWAATLVIIGCLRQQKAKMWDRWYSFCLPHVSSWILKCWLEYVSCWTGNDSPFGHPSGPNRFLL